MKARIRNIMTGEVIDVYSTIDSPDSSYGMACWVDENKQSYGQVQFGAPFGFELLEVFEEKEEESETTIYRERALKIAFDKG